MASRIQKGEQDRLAGVGHGPRRRGTRAELSTAPKKNGENKDQLAERCTIEGDQACHIRQDDEGLGGLKIRGGGRAGRRAGRVARE